MTHDDGTKGSIAPAFGGPSATRTAGAAGDRWRTPPALVASCALRWGPFDLDLAAEPGASVAPRWWGPGGDREDALAHDLRVIDVYGPIAGRAPMVGWCNPPFSRASEFVRLCERLSFGGHTVIQIAKLVPETRWWDRIWQHAHTVWVPDRRIRFVQPETGEVGGSPSHAHAIVVWQPNRSPTPIWRRCRLGPDQGVISWR